MSSDPNLPWFRRFHPDGRPEPHVTRGDDGEIAVIDSGWIACFRDGRWHDGMLFSHEQLAQFTPVQSRDDVYRVFNEARAALGLTPDDPFSNDARR